MTEQPALTPPTGSPPLEKSLVARLQEQPRVVAARTWLMGQYTRLSARERIILAALGLFVGGMIAWSGYEQASDIVADQSTRLEKAHETLDSTAGSLERYVKLKARRDMIEREYRGVEIKEGVYAHLENLIRTKLGLSSGFTIKDSPPKNMGGNFDQTTFTVKFTTPTLQPLVDFLKEVTHGQRPLLLSSLDAVKSRRGDVLEVTIEVVSIRESTTPREKKD